MPDDIFVNVPVTIPAVDADKAVVVTAVNPDIVPLLITALDAVNEVTTAFVLVISPVTVPINDPVNIPVTLPVTAPTTLPVIFPITLPWCVPTESPSKYPVMFPFKEGVKFEFNVSPELIVLNPEIDGLGRN